MKDGSREEQVSRHGVFEDYENFLLHLCQEVGPCRDPPLLQKAARYLQIGEPAETFPLLPFYQTALQGCRALSTDCRKHLSAVIKAAELLETLCVNLFLQPWKKEIRTLKTYTGPFVYYLLPVLSSSTIQSVLASIGYLPHTDTPLSEYRLSEDADPQRAMLLGFELLLARVECYNLLELLEKLGPQEWLDVLRRKAGPQKLEDAPEENTTKGQKEKEEEQEEGEIKKEEQADRKEAPLSSDNRLEFRPQPKPRRNHLNSVDQSIMEMHISYPDLSIKGRRLVPHRALRADSSWSGSREAPTGSTSYSDVAEAVKGPTAAAATTVRRRDDGLTAEDVTGDQRGVAGCTDRSSGSASSSTTDGGRLDDELSGPLSLHLTHSLRAGSAAGQSPEPGDTQPPAEPPAEHTAAELQNKTADPQKLSSLSSLDEVKMLKELEERMGQLCVQDTKEEGKGKDYKREEENTTKERRRREKKASAEGEAEEQNLGKPLIETGPAPSHAACRSSQSHPTEMKEQKQPAECPHSPLSARKANCQICAGETGQGEEEQLAQSFVIL